MFLVGRRRSRRRAAPPPPPAPAARRAEGRAAPPGPRTASWPARPPGRRAARRSRTAAPAPAPPPRPSGRLAATAAPRRSRSTRSPLRSPVSTLVTWSTPSCRMAASRMTAPATMISARRGSKWRRRWSIPIAASVVDRPRDLLAAGTPPLRGGEPHHGVDGAGAAERHGRDGRTSPAAPRGTPPRRSSAPARAVAGADLPGEAEHLGQPDGAQRHAPQVARLLAGRVRHLGRAAADVDHQRPRARRACPAARPGR